MWDNMSLEGVWVAECLALLTLDQEVPGSNPGGRIKLMTTALYYTEPFIITLPAS